MFGWCSCLEVVGSSLVARGTLTLKSGIKIVTSERVNQAFATPTARIDSLRLQTGVCLVSDNY